jgi:hypothetical protein
MGSETISGNGEAGTKEAEALAAALNHSVDRVQTLWFSFLTFMIYLAIATGTTTHRMLFLEEQLNLPVLNIKLPLLGFYILTPVIFVVLHFYMLLNLVLLARTAKSFEDAVMRAFPEDGEARENFRMRIENTLFVQGSNESLIQRRPWKARTRWQSFGPLARHPLGRIPVAAGIAGRIKRRRRRRFMPLSLSSGGICFFKHGVVAGSGGRLLPGEWLDQKSSARANGIQGEQP